MSASVPASTKVFGFSVVFDKRLDVETGHDHFRNAQWADTHFQAGVTDEPRRLRSP